MLSERQTGYHKTKTGKYNRILKMLSLPVGTFKLCTAKFIVLLVLAASQILMITGIYFASAAIAGQIQDCRSQ